MTPHSKFTTPGFIQILKHQDRDYYISLIGTDRTRDLPVISPSGLVWSKDIQSGAQTLSPSHKSNIFSQTPHAGKSRYLLNKTNVCIIAKERKWNLYLYANPSPPGNSSSGFSESLSPEMGWKLRRQAEDQLLNGINGKGFHQLLSRPSIECANLLVNISNNSMKLPCLLRYNRRNKYWAMGVRKAERESSNYAYHSWILHIFAPLFWFYGISSLVGLSRERQKKAQDYLIQSQRNPMFELCSKSKKEIHGCRNIRDERYATLSMSNTNLKVRLTPSFPHHSLTQNTQLETKLRNYTNKRWHLYSSWVQKR